MNINSKITNLSFELINNDKLIESFKPAIIPKARYYFILIGFGVGIILSLLTLLIEDIIQGAPLFSAVTDVANIHHIITPVLLGVLGIIAGIFYDKYSKRQKLIYNAFFESQQALKLITDNLPSLISYVTSDLHYLFANKTYSNWLKISPNEVFGKHISEILGEKAYNEVLPYINMALAGQSVSFEGIRLYQGLNKQFIKTSLVPHFDNDSKIIGVFVLTTDITQLKKRENRIKKQKKELQKINAAKDKLFSVIAHDLKSPFNPILGFSQLLSEEIDTLSQKEIKEISKMLFQQSKDAFNLLSNILDWSRTQLNGIEASKEIIDLKEVIEEVVDFVDDNAQIKNIKLSAEIKDKPRVFADRNLLYSVLRNLITNAIKFTPENGEITVQAKERQHEIEMSVSDTGLGMTQEQLKSLFHSKSEYYSTYGTNNEKGTGLGLIICKEFVEKNGGKLNVASVKEKGSTFSFTIPRPQQQSIKV
ncbi:MAG TPA: HAMP domain-containing sensor histidine kinase [Draconibacterium sp.]|nr:HAMP domain-containing sensor histidine kinase [Draconibacterium sp.]